MSEILSQAEIEALMESIGGAADVDPSSTGGAQLTNQPLNGSDLNEFGELQAKLWSSISLTVSESVGSAIDFGPAQSASIKPEQVSEAAGEATLVGHFTFSNLPNISQLILLPVETALALATSILGSQVTEIDAGARAALQPVFDGIVQGLCIAVGQIGNAIVTANDFVVQFEVLELPESLAATGELVRIQVALTAEGLQGSALWITDPNTARFLIGRPEVAPERNAEQRVPVSTKSQAESYESREENSSVERLLDISLELDVELARTRMLLKDVANLDTGSIVETDKTAGEEVDILIEGQVVARGHVVVVDDHYGVRITQVLNPRDRLKRLMAAA